MFKKRKELEKRVKALEDIVKELLEKQKQEEDFLNPPVLGGRK